MAADGGIKTFFTHFISSFHGIGCANNRPTIKLYYYLKSLSEETGS